MLNRWNRYDGPRGRTLHFRGLARRCPYAVRAENWEQGTGSPSGPPEKASRTHASPAQLQCNMRQSCCARAVQSVPRRRAVLDLLVGCRLVRFGSGTLPTVRDRHMIRNLHYGAGAMNLPPYDRCIETRDVRLPAVAMSPFRHIAARFAMAVCFTLSF